MASALEQEMARRAMKRRPAGYAGEAPTEGEAGGRVPGEVPDGPVGEGPGAPPAPGTEPRMPRAEDPSVPPAPVPAQEAPAAVVSPTSAPAIGPQSAAPVSDKDTVKNSYRDIIEKGSNVDPNDPVIRRQADAFAAAQERSRRNSIADAAEGYGPLNTGALQGEARIATERAGQASGAFEAELVAREMSARRDTVMEALRGLYGAISDEDRNQLQRELAYLNASLEQARMAQQQTQFEDELGFRIGDREAYWNWQATQGLQ